MSSYVVITRVACLVLDYNLISLGEAEELHKETDAVKLFTRIFCGLFRTLLGLCLTGLRRLIEPFFFCCCDEPVQLFAHSLEGLFVKLFLNYVKEDGALRLGRVYFSSETLLAKLGIDTSLEGGGLVSELLLFLIRESVFLIDQALLHIFDLLQRFTDVDVLANWLAALLWHAWILALKLLDSVAYDVFIDELVLR